MVESVLQAILRTKRAEVEQARGLRPVAEVRRTAAAAPRPRDFLAALAGAPPIRLIAEIKKASPSAGLIRADFRPAEIARAYAAGGAAALSVLTDRPYFQGDLSFVSAVKDVVPLPVLRKDFIIDAYQVDESRAAGADAILLIAAALSPAEIGEFTRQAGAWGMASLIEVHTAEELRRLRGVIAGGQRVMLGINNRDLATQRVDLATTARLAGEIDAGVLFVAESGIRSREDVLMMEQAGASAVLVGETLMRAPDIQAAARGLLSSP